MKFFQIISVLLSVMLVSMPANADRNDTLRIGINLTEEPDINKMSYPYYRKKVAIDEDKVCEFFRMSRDTWKSLNETDITYAALKPDGTPQYGSTAEGIGHWFDSSGQPCEWDGDAFVFSELQLHPLHLAVGQYPARCKAGDTFRLAQSLSCPTADGTVKTVVFDITLSILPLTEYEMPDVAPDTVNIENPRVRAYLEEAHYTSADDISLVENHILEMGGERLDEPRPVVIPFTSFASAGGTFIYSTSPELKNPTVVPIYRGDDCGTIMNPVPGTSIYYRAVCGGRTLAEGCVQIAGKVRMITVPSVMNVRDIGGWQTEDGHRIRYGLIFRGGEMDFNPSHLISNDDISELRRLGIKAEIDLRGDTETFGESSALGNDIKYFYGGHTSSTLASMISDSTLWKRDFEELLANIEAGLPTYVHCAWGADRTGITIMTCEGLLGVPLDGLIKDYELTSFSAMDDTRTLEWIVSKLRYIESLSGNTLREKFETYYHEVLHVPAEMTERFRQLMLEEAVAEGIQDIHDTNTRTEPDNRDGRTYTISGMRVAAPSRGLYITDKKKILNK